MSAKKYGNPARSFEPMGGWGCVRVVMDNTDENTD